MGTDNSASWSAGHAARLGLPILVTALAIVTLYGAFLYAPREKVMGDIQRIFYFHASAGLVCFFAFLVTCIASIAYLTTRRRWWDMVGLASAESGMLMCTIVLLTGPLWARPVWGTYWTWEARLTTSLVLWLIYAAYLLVRRYTDDPDQQARFAAVVGIVGFLDVPIVYWSVQVWRGHHPIVLKASGGGGLDPSMRKVFLGGILTYFALYACLMALRVPIGRDEEELRLLREQSASAIPGRPGPALH